MPSNDELIEGLDPFAAAARRTRQSVRPEGGRKYGPTSYVIENFLPHVAGNAASLPQRATEAAGQLQQTGDQYDPGPVLETALMMMMGRIPTVKPGEAGVFGGKLSKTADLDALKTAQEIEKMQNSKLENHTWTPKEMEVRNLRDRIYEPIRQETGWFRGDDGHWKYEIPDTWARTSLKGMAEARVNRPPAIEPHDPLSGTTLERYMDHPALYEAYPHLKNYQVDTFKNEPYGGLHWPGQNRISINNALPRTKAHSVMLHEIQHGIQEHEGFAPGGNPGWIKSKFLWDAPRETLDKFIDVPDKAWNAAADKVYRRHAGEVESRNVQKRAADKAFSSLPPWESVDTNRWNQVFPTQWQAKQSPEIQAYIRSLLGK
jgi:hypothetical protein